MMYLNYGAIEAFDCERVAIVLPSQAYEEGQYPEAIVAHHAAGLNATPVKLGVTYVAKSECDQLKAENAKLRELLLDCWDFSHLMHGAMAARFYELGLIGDGEARELGIEVGHE